MSIHHPRRLAACALSLSLLGASASAQTTKPADAASYEPEITLAGKTLQLNGSGIRKRLFFNVYSAALYLPQKARTPAEVYSAPGPKRFKASFLRELDSAGFGKTTMQVMNDNLPKERMSRCIPGLVKLSEVFAAKKRIGPGEHYTIDEIPGKGTIVSINGAAVAEIAEPEFFTCLMYNYFGDKPADANLKIGLLGGAVDTK